MAVLLVFILLGHWLEMRARAGASSAIKALMNLTPATATVIRNGAETEVPTAEVLAGEIVVIRWYVDTAVVWSYLTIEHRAYRLLARKAS